MNTTTFNKDDVRKELNRIMELNSEQGLLSLLKKNSFLFSDIFSRQYGVQPIFHEVSFGTKFRCDFCWLNDNSDGPEWVLVEVEKPKIKLFNKNDSPASQLNSAIEQVSSWSRYFNTNPNEKNRIFGAVSKFRYVLIAGLKEDWENDHALVWRNHFNSTSEIEIRSMDVFSKALYRFVEHKDFFSFEQHPTTKPPSELAGYCNSSPYLRHWKAVLTSNV